MRSLQISRSTSSTNLVLQLKILKNKLRSTLKQLYGGSTSTRENWRAKSLTGWTEKREVEVLGCRITVLEEDNEGWRSERDELKKANTGAQKLVTMSEVS
jgi:hypothetical protein